ncbi:TPA: hypothetical protein R8G48_002112 [Citrobacter braakii]|nr:hypothetical protein [Citrobacter braakii]
MALSLLAANNAQTVLAAGISSTATSLTVNAGTGTLFPSPAAGTSFFKLTIIDAATGSLTEIVHVTARAGDVFTIQRGQEGTVQRAWSANDIAANMMTAGTLSYILGNFQPLDPTLTALAALVGVANKLPYFNGDDTAALTDITQVGRDIIGKSTIADILTYLGLVNNGVVGRLIGRPRIITSSETYIPTSGAKFAWVQIVGGGGGGGGATASQNFNAAGGGGGAGGYAAKWVDLSSISSVVVTIGAGGNGTSASGTNGSSGGITSFGSIFSASGGSLGNSAVGTGNNTSTIVGAGNQGGTGTGGDLNCSGGSGLGGVSASPTIAGASVGPGIGGSSILSGPGGYGAGGNGGATVANSVPGSSGRSGIAIIWEYA